MNLFFIFTLSFKDDDAVSTFLEIAMRDIK
jgi:hypothetical protein